MSARAGITGITATTGGTIAGIIVTDIVTGTEKGAVRRSLVTSNGSDR
jgi:hypothetical protein